MALPTNQDIDNAIRTSNTGTDVDRPIRLSTNELLKAFRQEIANTQQDLANKVNSSTFNALADVARTGSYSDINGRPQQYGGTGQNTDGYMTQKAITEALGDKADLVGGKVPFEQLPSSLASGVVFKGTWSAATNQDNSGNPLPATPLADGEYYIVNTAGTQFGLTFVAGDWIIAVDGQWYKLEPDSAVSSVNGQAGAVVIDVGVTSVGVTVPAGLVVANTPITEAGTIDIALGDGYKIPTQAELDDKGIEPPAGWLEAGNETKYLAGDGTLKDIPSDTQSDYAQTNPSAPDYIKNKPELFSKSYGDLTDKPLIPTKTSELTNDSEFITDASLTDLSDRVDAALTKTFAPWQPDIVANEVDETKYPENPEGKGYEIVGLAQPTQWDALGKEVKNGDFIVFDNDGLPKEVGGEEVDLSEYTKRSGDETITGEWDFQGAMKVGDYTYNTTYGPFPVEKLITYVHPSLSSPLNIAYGIDTGDSFSSMAVAFNVDDLGLGESIITNLLTEDVSITGGYTGAYSVTSKESDGTVVKRMVIEANAGGGMGTSISVFSRSDGASYLTFNAGTEPVRGMYASDILTESSGITIKEALDSKVDKAQDKAALENYLKAKTAYHNITLVNNLFTHYDGGASKTGDTLTFTSDGKARYVLDEPLNVGDTIAYVFTVTENNETALTLLGLRLGYDANLFSSIGLHFSPLLPNVVYAAVIHIKTTDTAEVCLVDVSTGESSATATPPATVPLPEPLSTLLHVGVIASRGSAWGGNVVFKDESLENDSLKVRYFADLVQETGDSQTHVMTQKAVTDALGNKVDKIQEKVILTASRALTQADMYKVLLVSADGITITLPTGIPNFTVDIVKMDEGFTTLAQTSSTDKFREDVSTITIVKDVTIFSTGVVGKEYVAIGAYEA